MRTLLPLAALCLSAAANADTPAPPKQPPACAAAEFHQFDFWVGDWDVTNPQGKAAGQSRIEAILDDCAISENWRGAGGTVGRSYSAWDASNKRWNQYWVATDGQVLYLGGGLVDGRMVLSGDTIDAKSGKRSPQRVTWTPNTDGTVTQLWQTSDDSGKTWRTVFEGNYKRAEKKP
ncbi:MAG: hypothetical protein JNN30_04090 [Rhodanobacteraceae bacterium]|nr:hypothetical protein [Rhodanobacteraceae bacterium]